MSDRFTELSDDAAREMRTALTEIRASVYPRQFSSAGMPKT